MKLGLGTVQFGVPYGVTNTVGQVNPTQAQAITQRAYAAGIDTLDTAIAYGSSETVLGDIGIRPWKVVTKLPAVPEHCDDISSWVKRASGGLACAFKAWQSTRLATAPTGSIAGRHWP